MIVFFDTNCYRLIARENPADKIPAIMNNIKKQETAKNLKPLLNYWVVSELFTHLSDDINKTSYHECKFGLLSAFLHIDADDSSFLHQTDNEIYSFFFNEMPNSEIEREGSLAKAISMLFKSNFDDDYIRENEAAFRQTENFIQAQQDSWINSIVNYFIAKHDPSYTGGWIVLANDREQRLKLLDELKTAEDSGNVFNEFAIGMCGYICKNHPDKIIHIDHELIQRLIKRFKPLFLLQLKIMKLLCTTSGYNLRKKENDVIDFLIASSLDHGSSIFVSNETKHLVPFLKENGYADCVLSFHEYLKLLGIEGD